MKKFLIKKSKTGKGLFAAKNIKKEEKLFSIDLTKQKSYSRKETAELNSEHCDYVGRGRYVISFHPYSYINHSCSPNILVKHRTIAKSDFYAMRDIKKEEELTYDYGANALDQFGKSFWVMKCRCRSKNCREKIPGDFFKQPIKIQKKYFKYLPTSIKRKYKSKLKRLIQ